MVVRYNGGASISMAGISHKETSAVDKVADR